MDLSPRDKEDHRIRGIVAAAILAYDKERKGNGNGDLQIGITDKMSLKARGLLGYMMLGNVMLGLALAGLLWLTYRGNERSSQDHAAVIRGQGVLSCIVTFNEQERESIRNTKTIAGLYDRCPILSLFDHAVSQ